MTTVALATAFVVSLVALAVAWRSPGNNQGYEPAQPVAFSHRLHAGDMQIACAYCHLAAETSRYAGIPALSTCMNCHKSVIASLEGQKQVPAKESVELRKIYDALALDQKLTPLAGRTPKPIAWTRVHVLPDFGVLRPSRAYRCVRNLSDLPRTGRDDGAGPAGRNARDGLVRELSS